MDFGPGVSVQVRQSHGCWVLAVAGHADHDEEDKLTSAMRETATVTLPMMVIDLSALTFADTSFIHWLLMARRDHAHAGTRLILAGPLHGHVQRVLTVTGLLDHFTLADDLDTALGHAAPVGRRRTQPPPTPEHTTLAAVPTDPDAQGIPSQTSPSISAP